MLCRDTSHGGHSLRLACLRSHVLRAYCNFESKQAIYNSNNNIIGDELLLNFGAKFQR